MESRWVAFWTVDQEFELTVSHLHPGPHPQKQMPSTLDTLERGRLGREREPCGHEVTTQGRRKLEREYWNSTGWGLVLPTKKDRQMMHFFLFLILTRQHSETEPLVSTKKNSKPWWNICR